jgi:hypothetical protein
VQTSLDKLHVLSHVQVAESYEAAIVAAAKAASAG